MSESLRVLAPRAVLAAICAAVLVMWIRLQPLEMPRTLQAVMTTMLVVAVGVTVGLARRAGQT